MFPSNSIPPTLPVTSGVPNIEALYPSSIRILRLSLLPSITAQVKVNGFLDAIALAGQANIVVVAIWTVAQVVEGAAAPTCGWGVHGITDRPWVTGAQVATATRLVPPPAGAEQRDVSRKRHQHTQYDPRHSENVSSCHDTPPFSYSCSKGKLGNLPITLNEQMSVRNPDAIGIHLPTWKLLGF